MLDVICTQAAFGDAVGVSQQAVSDLCTKGVLRQGGTAGEWLLAYCHRLREQAAGRMGSEVGGLDLAQERAALAKSQREGIELRNAVARQEYAPVSLLSEVLAHASQAVSERFDHLPGALRQACPNMPGAAIDQAVAVITAARNTWARDTAELVTAAILTTSDPQDGESVLDHEPGSD